MAPGSPQLHSSRAPAFVRWLAWFLGLLLIGLALLYQCFSERKLYFDEIGLFNPIYMFLHYGKMTYPAHEQFDAMFVHPPTQYLLVATLMRTGMSVYHAAGLLSVLLFAGFVALVVQSRLTFAVQSGFLLGAFLGAFVWNEALVLRPDLTLTLAWGAGLVAFETARLHAWDSKRLAIGGFFLALATAVHYTGVLTAAAAAVYAIWMWKDLGWTAARRRLLGIVCGGAVIGAPYILLFVIPHLRQILDFAQLVQDSAPPGTAFQRHMDSYHYWHSIRPHAMQLRPVTTMLTDPLFRWTMPAAFVGPALLLVFPATRAMALAALPHLLFILYGARHKQTNYTGYFAPEVMLYLMALLSVLGTLVFRQLERLKPFWVVGATAVAATTAAAAVVATEVPVLLEPKITPTRGIYDLETGRAAARSLLGRDAVVGTASAGVWYTSGATHFYLITPDLIYPKDIRALDVKSYFRSFDALAADPHQSWISYNSQRVNVTSSYVDGTLELRGFFFADRRAEYQSLLSYMLYSSARPRPLMGYAVTGETVSRFVEQPDGDSVFLSAVCPTSYGEGHGPLDNTDLQLDAYAVFFRPIATNEDPRITRDHTLPAAIITLMTDRARFDRTIRPALRGCTVRDEIRGHVAALDLRRFIDESERADQPIRFYQTYNAFWRAVSQLPGHRDLLNHQGIPNLSNSPAGPLLPIPGVQMDSIALAYEKASIQRGRVVRITTASERWSFAASLPIAMDKTFQSRAVIHVRARVVKGQIGVGILDRHANAFQREDLLDVSERAQDIYLPIPSPDRADDLIIRNTSAEGIASEIEVDGIELLAPAQRLDDPIAIDSLALLNRQASITRGRSVTVTTGPGQWAYAAELPIHRRTSEPGMVAVVRARVLKGEIGFGILAADEKSFTAERRYPAAPEPVQVTLRLPLAEASRLIIRNTTADGTPAQVAIDGIELWRLQ